MDPTMQLDAAGRRRSPATLPGYHSGRAPGNKGRRYPADPPRVEEIVAVMRQAGERPAGLRIRGLIVVLWRAGLRVSEALALTEGDLEPGRGAMLARHGKAGDGRLGWTAGDGASSNRGWSAGCRCQLARSSASSTDLRLDGLGRRPLRERSSGALPSRRPFAVDSPRTNYVTPMQSRWQGKAFP